MFKLFAVYSRVVKGAILLFSLVACGISVYAQSIRVRGRTWTVTIGDLAVPAGENAFPDVESGTNQIRITVSGQGSRWWVVTVNKVDMTWDDAMVLSVQRTSDGTGSGQISGGTSYVAIPNTPAVEFFRGRRNKNNVPCQYQIHCDEFPYVGNYSTTVYYTVTNL